MRKSNILLAQNFKNTFLSLEKDQEIIWKKLFVESYPYSDKLKRLLVVNTPDCLDENQLQYKSMIDDLSLKDLKDKGYIKIVPKISQSDFAEIKSHIVLEFDDYVPSNNPEYRNCVISFTILCHLDCWELDDYKLRPHQIAGYIDGILNETKLTGIGTLQFMGASQIVVDENIGGMMMRYIATNSKANDSENLIPEWPSAPQDL